MTTTGTSSALRTAFGWHRPLMTLAAAMTALIVAGVVGMVADERVLTGLPIWDKPTKFAISVLIYAVTWAWLIAVVRDALPGRPSRLGHRAGTVAAVMLGVEMVIIVTQVVRGETSHFNTTTPLNAALWSVMGLSIAVVWVATLSVTAQLFRVRGLDPARARAIRAGAVLAVVGMALGFLMTSPTAAQMAGDTGIVGAHTVGLADGGPGLPLLGWSTVGGDLRIPHFVGMHALQAIPLVLVALELLAVRVAVLRSPEVRRGLVGVAAAGFAAVLALLTWQALRGQSVVAPDALTVSVFGLIVAGTAAGSVRAPRLVSA
ncbi:MAG: hypothetical protein JWP64_2196 [Pseudonocardia sp.]|jgi:hypothetical protein|uniref:hypothetical protein n=1 Tax=Pseudonocardia sp. TaxID=60912 RepID=UPI002612E954|nr:hypothetical protein [Pseudonocardia sp.]MCU1627247.1 hypothetical protein [Pseudonocardia sp.]MDT7702397.1 hypothetical protein [Pseudonocardiales bacterium]